MNILCRISGKESENLVVVSTDAGFAKTARSYATILDTPVAIGDKIRTGHDEKAKVLGIIGDVKGKNALIVDDFMISGGTLIDTARVLKQNGAEKITACISHCLINEKGVKALEDSPIEELIVTDTVENKAALACPKVKVVTVSGLFAEAVRIIHNKESLSSLFDNDHPVFR
jgi:ribose-phosphate pyrophosphokinase